MATGIRKRHSTTCASRAGGRCRCEGRWEAWVWIARESKRVHKSFPTETEAKAWRADATSAVRTGTMAAPSKQTIREAAETWLEGAEAGTVRDRSGRTYKPSTLRGYRRSLRQRVLPEFGSWQLTELRRSDVQAWIDGLLGENLAAATVRNTVNPLQAIYRHAIRRDLVTVNPTRDLEMPAARGKRDRIASAQEAQALLEALPDEQRAVWATAFYAGLRRGELRALRWCDVDLGRLEIAVSRSWDEVAAAQDPKTETSERTVPILAVLRDYLIAHKMDGGRDGEDLVFGRTATSAFVPSTIDNRAKRAWEKAKLAKITMHECRHTFASLLIDAGVNAKAIQTFMGHSTIEMTYDQYGHLLPGAREQARDLVDRYLDAAAEEARHSLATVDPSAERFPAVSDDEGSRGEAHEQAA